MSLTKADLVEQVCSRCPRTTLVEVKEFVAAVFAIMKGQLAAGEPTESTKVL